MEIETHGKLWCFKYGKFKKLGFIKYGKFKKLEFIKYGKFNKLEFIKFAKFKKLLFLPKEFTHWLFSPELTSVHRYIGKINLQISKRRQLAGGCGRL